MSNQVGADPFENEYDPNLVENLYRKRIKEQDRRIEQLEAALRHYVCDCIAPDCEVGAHGDAICGIVARAALEGKKDEIHS